MMENKPCKMLLNPERVRALETWLQATNTKLTQVNGQRKYGGPPEVWDGPIPGAHCEVFISQIPRDAYEDLLIPLFSSVGPLWEFRLMMNFSGQNRGFAYAKYGSSAIANRAIRTLQGHMLEPGLRLSVRHSTEKRQLCLSGLPASTRQHDLLQVLRGMAEGVERVSLKAGPDTEGVTAVIAFSSHHAASMAKKVLVEGLKRQFALSVSIKWRSAEKPSAAKLPPPQHPMKPAGRAQASKQRFALPPRLARSRSIPPGFCRAVGGPTVTPTPPTAAPPSSSSCSQRPAGSVTSSLLLLSRLCEATRVGQPLYEMHYSHTGTDGFLYFTYKVRIPGVTTTFKGLVMILPGPTTSTTLEEAQRAAAQQVLQRVYNNQLDP